MLEILARGDTVIDFGDMIHGVVTRTKGCTVFLSPQSTHPKAGRLGREVELGAYS